MGIFKKGGPDVIDLTELKKKGILDRSKAIARDNERGDSNEGKIVDLTSTSSSYSNSEANEPSALGFLSSLAGAAGESGSGTGASSFNSSGDISGLKNKIEDIEYKLERLIERLGKIEEKMQTGSG